MAFSVLYWNIWLENQIRGEADAYELIEEIRHIIHTYTPDIIGLNEVLRHTDHDRPFILDILKSCGYAYHHFAPASPYTKDWIIGAGVASKIPLTRIEDVELGYDTRAERRGFAGHTIKAIRCSFRSGNEDIHLIVSHLICLRAHTLKDHYAQSQNLKHYITEHAPRNTIIGGDFNEPRGMPSSFFASTRPILHHRTGSLIRPTWSHNGSKITPVRANLDRLFWTKKGNLQLTSCQVLPVKASDHKPLFARFDTEQ